ncbi:excalibur calcium-binding domain-containing protein [Nocardia rhamnosiphila]|uniref:excalibur calcium-binding domain-containing protein n=1 Tax=Nocardia rhamnosiphila TaxID=426716 RepID=UPI0034047F90
MPEPGPPAAPEPEWTPEPTTAAPPPAPAPSNVYYKNCSAARAAGAAPLYTGDPGYGRHLDRDGDGVACE